MFHRENIEASWTQTRSLKAAEAVLVLACVVLFAMTSGRAQVLDGSLGRGTMTSGSSRLTSAVATINLAAVLPTSIGVSVSNIHLMVSVKDPNNPTDIIRVPVSSFWRLGTSSSGVKLIGYFESPQQALVDTHGRGIPSTRVEAGVSGQPLESFTETSRVGTPGASRTLYRQPISRNNFSGSRNDVIEIRVAKIADLGLESGTYGGTLRLRMVAY